MAKKALLDVLEQTIGKYVRNLDAESLNVALWSGKIELNALELDVDAVNGELDRQAAEAPNLAFPFRVVTGQFGSFTVDVPWANLMSKSVILRASSLSVVIEPHDRSASADFLSAVVESESLRAKTIIQHRLQSIVLANDFRQRKNALKELAEQDMQTNSVDEIKRTDSFSSRLVRRIIENMQVEVTGVNVMLHGMEGEAGIVLKSLKLVTTDRNGVQKFVDRTLQSVDEEENNFLHKSLSISGLGIYLDDTLESIKDNKNDRLSSIDEDIDKDNAIESDTSALDHSYILAPLSFEASLRQADSQICLDFPKYFLRSELNSLSILLARRQMELARSIARQIHPSNSFSRPIFPEYRPLERVSRRTASDWWKYTTRCIGRLNGRRSWVEFFHAFQKRKRYIGLYRRFAHSDVCKWVKALDEDEHRELEKIEMDRSISIDGLMYWRNISDSQVKKEREKYETQKSTKTKSIFTSLFGSNAASNADAEEPPVTLSVEELKELEDIDHVPDAELNNDSKLYDVRFVLGSLRVHLTSFGARQLAALKMGTVSTSFNAKADGSFCADFGMRSLHVQDKFTLNTFFPSVLKNQSMSHSNLKASDESEIHGEPGTHNTMKTIDALTFHLNKSKEGHQELVLKLSTFEAIASPLFLLELFRFVDLSIATPSSSNNAWLSRSVSGSVDLFYDANDGGSVLAEATKVNTYEWSHDNNRKVLLDEKGQKDLSQTLIDAWQTKTRTKAFWLVDLDLQAPIVLLPESSIDPNANVLVFDLGHLKFNYGQRETIGNVLHWFRENPRSGSDVSAALIDNGSLRISSLTFAIGKIGFWQRLTRKHDEDLASQEEEAIIKPVSLDINFGIESSAQVEIPRICLFGVLPSVICQLSYEQLSRIIAVSVSLKKLLNRISPNADLAYSRDKYSPTEDSEAGDSISSLDNTNKWIEGASLFKDRSNSAVWTPFAKVHANFQLKRISTKILTEHHGALHASLFAVRASTTIRSDGSSEANLSMGLFSIYDCIVYDFPREQRLFVHSKLPTSLEKKRNEGQLLSLEMLDEIVFLEGDSSEPTELANIIFKQCPTGTTFGTLDPYDVEEMIGDVFNVEAIIDASFSSLFVNWNPQAVKVIHSLLGEFLQALNFNHEEVGDLIADVHDSKKRLLPPDTAIGQDDKQKNRVSSVLLVRAKLDGIHLSLNSAQDDLPLFSLTMSEASLSMVSGPEDSRKIDMVLGALNIFSSNAGETSSLYRNVLGLASSSSSSLLTIKYFSGEKAIKSILTTDCDSYGAYGEIVLSPMRLVYIQAQILALVEYFTAGILGALATQAASSAALAAADMATPTNSKTKFIVRASKFDMVLPTAAYISQSFALYLSNLEVEYSATLELGGKAVISLSDVSLESFPDGGAILLVPVKMKLCVLLPPDGSGSKEDQAMRVDLDISNAPFRITKPQYQQMFSTLEGNIGELNLFLRNSTATPNDKFESTASPDPKAAFDISHAGVAIIDNPRWIFFKVDMKSLSLMLCGEDDDEPLIMISAVEASVDLKMFSDQGKKSAVVTLRDLFCEDQRMKALARQHRSLIYQSQSANEIKDAFVITYFSDFPNKICTIDLAIGSPRFVLIPDAIADVLSFLTQSTPAKVAPKLTTPATENYQELVEVNANDESASIETYFVKQNLDQLVTSTIFSVKTSNCKIIFVDLGTATNGAGASRTLMSMSSVAETLVLGGVFHSKVSISSFEGTSSMSSLESEFHGEDIEIYTAFSRDLHSAVQILDPAHFAFYYDSKTTQQASKIIDIKCAVLTSLDITVSMRNFALVNAITTSLSDCFSNEDKRTNETIDSEASLEPRDMTPYDADRTEKLASLLETDFAEDSERGTDISQSREENSMGSSNANYIMATMSLSFKLTTSDIQCTIVNDLQGLDEALLRVTVRNFVAKGKLTQGTCIAPGLPTYTAFDFTFNTSILADYFDASANAWKVFLLKPWEVSMKGRRGPNQTMASNRPSTVVDVDSQSCHISFSEQFLMSLASANRMWAVYSAASLSAIDKFEKSAKLSKALRRSMAASAARTFVAALPYALENHTGLNVDLIINGEKDARTCATGSVEYFRFEPPPGRGNGGKRLYGQDVRFEKSVVLVIGVSKVTLSHLDSLVGQGKQSRRLEDGLIVMTHVFKEGKSIILNVSSGIDFYNRTSVPISISVLEGGAVGRCVGLGYHQQSSLQIKDGNVSRLSRRLALPLLLSQAFREEFENNNEARLSLVFTIHLANAEAGWELSGGSKLSVSRSSFLGLPGTQVKKRFDVNCRPFARGIVSSLENPRSVDPFVFQVSLVMVLVDDLYPSLQFEFEPRCVILNKLPIGLLIKSPMPHILDPAQSCHNEENEIREIAQNSYLEIFTPGPSIAIMIKCRDMPVGGSNTDWMDGGWVDLPLSRDFRLKEPISCMLPFLRKVHDIMPISGVRGSEFFIVDGTTNIRDLTQTTIYDETAEKSSENQELVALETTGIWRSFTLMIRNYAVDHTGSVLFEQVEQPDNQNIRKSSKIRESIRRSTLKQGSLAFGAFATNQHCGRISLLPASNTRIRILHLTMQGDDGLRRTEPFYVDDVSICNGGVDSTPLAWEGGKTSGFFAYRNLISTDQSVVHIIPEYIVYNGSDSHRVRVKYSTDGEVVILPGKIGLLPWHDNEIAAISVEYSQLGACTPVVCVDSLGLRVAVVKLADGTPIARIAVQVVVGGRDSRLVVKLGDIQRGALLSHETGESKEHAVLRDDFIRFRMRWDELQLTLNEARPTSNSRNAIVESALDQFNQVVSPTSTKSGEGSKNKTWVQARQRLNEGSFRYSSDIDKAVCTIRFLRFTVDWQKVFKDESMNTPMSVRLRSSSERSQLSIVVHHVQIKDENPGSLLPIVFDSTSEISFFDLCIRTRGPSNADLILVDLIDLNLAHKNGKSEKIFISTSEDFVWKVLDVANRILEAAAEFAGMDIHLEWDESNECFNVSISEQNSSVADHETKYTPPKSDVLYHIKKTKVSPFMTVISFRRNPQATRYKLLQNVRGAPILNYFTRQLKFKIEKAELNFSRYEANDIKGPVDRVIELLSTVYLSRVQTKLVTIMTAASFQDWKYLASRDGGDDEFMDGDILRVTGNLAGKTAGYVLRHAGQGLGDGVHNAASTVGQGIENVSAKMGVRIIGAGVNSVVTGVGEGVGNAFTGVGTGAGQVFQGAGQGIGHVFGGITGGAMIVGKGIGKGIISGDGRAAASGIVNGATTIGTGVGQGVESVVTGAAEGVMSVGHGLFSGVKNVGKGIGDAFLGCCYCTCCFGSSECIHSNALADPLMPP